MLFDLSNWTLRQILANFGDDQAFHVGMKGVAQVCQRAGRGYDNERCRLAFTHQLFQSSRDMARKTVLFEIMPVSRRHLAAAIGPRPFEYTARSISALLVSRRVLINEDALRFQIWILSSPELRRNKALRPSPMKTKAS